MNLNKYIDYLNSHRDIVAYRHTKDLGGNDYFMAAVETTCANGNIIYYIYSIYHVLRMIFAEIYEVFALTRQKIPR